MIGFFIGLLIVCATGFGMTCLCIAAGQTDKLKYRRETEEKAYGARQM